MSETIRLLETDRLDEHLSLLADSERCSIITHLRDASTDTASLADLATALATHTPCDRDHARMRLHHGHLPKLAQTPLLSYDPATTTVEYHDDPELETLLDILQAHETRHQTPNPNHPHQPVRTPTYQPIHHEALGTNGSSTEMGLEREPGATETIISMNHKWWLHA